MSSMSCCLQLGERRNGQASERNAVPMVADNYGCAGHISGATRMKRSCRDTGLCTSDPATVLARALQGRGGTMIRVKLTGRAV